MKYYQILPNFDGLQVLRWSDRARGLIVKRELIAGELYTRAELRRLLAGADFRTRPGLYLTGEDQVFQEVTIPKTKTFWSFGARFPFHDLQEGGAENALC